MSFTRLIYWSGLLGAWSAFVAWLVCELIFGRWLNASWGVVLAILMGTLVASAIGGGLSQASGLVNFRWQEQLARLGLGLVGGFLAGFIGSTIASIVFWLIGTILPSLSFFGYVFGWTILGAALGIVEGVYDRSLKKIRNGLIGGAAGGFVAGVLFIPVAWVIGSPMSSRAIGFVLLGGFVGILIGLVQVFLKEAWITVEGGFRAGRQLILSRPEITMGTSEKSSLIFIAMGAKGVEPLHLRIVRAPDGSFVLHDNGSRTGTFLNGAQIQQPTMLRSGDTIQFGVNVVRFNERFKRADAVGDQALPQPRAPMVAPLPVPALSPMSTGVAPGAPPIPKPMVAVAPRAAVIAAPARPAAPAVSPIQAAAPARPAVPSVAASRPAIPAVAPAKPVAPAAPPARPALPAAPSVPAPLVPAPSAAAPPSRPVPTACPVCGSHNLAKTADSCRCRSCFTVIY